MVDTSALVDGFYRPPVPMVNALTAQAEQSVVEWLWSIGMLTNAAQEEHLRSFEFGYYHGIATPTVDLAALMLGLKWFCWGSLADDQYDNYEGVAAGPRMAGLLRDVRKVLDGGRADSSNPVLAGLKDYWPALTRDMPAPARRRIERHFLDYLQAVMQQNRFHARGQVPDAATFLVLRRHTIAMIFQANVLEVVCGLSLPSALWEDRTFRELLDCFADITAWHNDIYGLEKDIVDRQTCNMVRVVHQSEGCSLTDAVRRVLERARIRQRLLMDIEEQLPELIAGLGLSTEIAAQAAILVEHLRAYVFANLAWISRTRRYDLDRPRVRGTFDDVLSAS